MKTKRKQFEGTLHLKTAISSTSASSAKDQADQKSYVVTGFDGNKLLTKLTKDLKVESLARSGWHAILHVKTAKGKVLNIIEHSTVITEKEIKSRGERIHPDNTTTGRTFLLRHGAPLQARRNRQWLNIARKSPRMDPASSTTFCATMLGLRPR